MSKTHEEAYVGLEGLASNNYQWTFERAMLKPMTEVLELDHISNLASELETLNET